LIAHLLGYGSEPVVAALDRLEILGLVERSPMSHRAHLYQFTVPADSTERDAWTHLLDLASQRAGRVRLSKHLSGGTRTAQAERDLTRHILDAAEQRVLASRRQLAIRQVLDAAEQRVLASRRQLPPPSGSEPPPS
jgi:hypothetical protein